jgi:hypothetical protein
MAKQTRKNLVAEYFGELCDFGGIAATRGEIYAHVVACGKSRGASDTSCHRGADRSAASYRRVQSPDECATRMTYGQAVAAGML